MPRNAGYCTHPLASGFTGMPRNACCSAHASGFQGTVPLPITTDDFGFNVVENPVHVHDLNATLLHLLGFDLTRLTDVHGNLVQGILA